MAPERLRAGQVDARSDIYALACVLYECLTGSTPYPGDSFEQQIRAHLMEPPPRPSSTDPAISNQVDEVIATGMAKHPDERYATTLELANAARRALTDQDQVQADTIAASTLSSEPPPAPWAATHPAPVPPTPIPLATSSSIPSTTDHARLAESGEGDEREVYDLQNPYTPTRALWVGIAAGVALIAVIVIIVVAFVTISPEP
jgi:serine/threonine protein kinase